MVAPQNVVPGIDSHAAYLSVLFKKEVGETLGEFRRAVTHNGNGSFSKRVEQV